MDKEGLRELLIFVSRIWDTGKYPKMLTLSKEILKFIFEGNIKGTKLDKTEYNRLLEKIIRGQKLIRLLSFKKRFVKVDMAHIPINRRLLHSELMSICTEVWVSLVNASGMASELSYYNEIISRG